MYQDNGQSLTITVKRQRLLRLAKAFLEVGLR